MKRKDGAGDQPPHPFISCGEWSADMETPKPSERQEKLLEEKFLAACKGNLPNHRMGVEKNSNRDISGYSEKVRIGWQPHNYRLYFTFNRSGFTPEKPGNHGLRKMGTMVRGFNAAYTWSLKNYDSEATYDGFMNCRITVKKRMVEVIPKSHFKQWRDLRGDSWDVIAARQVEILKKLELEARAALRVFIDLHGGSTSWDYARPPRIEDGVKGDDFLDSLPRDMVIHDPLFKKVYMDKVEFKGFDDHGVLRSQNYIHNRAVERVSPEIAKSLLVLSQRIADIPSALERRKDPIGWIFSQGHNVALNAMSSEDQSSWLQEAFNVSG